VKENDIALKPKSWNWVESASLGLAGLTSYQALVKAGLNVNGKDESKKNVLVIGASGGCGIFGVQLAKKYFGTTVTGVCST
jgi:NADPH:quinone reductase-like Zn-dependent oxidoreductase